MSKKGIEKPTKRAKKEVIPKAAPEFTEDKLEQEARMFIVDFAKVQRINHKHLQSNISLEEAKQAVRWIRQKQPEVSWDERSVTLSALVSLKQWEKHKLQMSPELQDQWRPHTFEYSRERVLEGMEQSAKYREAHEQLLKAERAAARRSAQNLKEFLARPDESFTLEEYERYKDGQIFGTMSDNSNNPNKSSDAPFVDSYKKKMRIERALKKTGKIPMTEEERLDIMLDDLYPNAPSGAVITYEGHEYVSRYTPIQKSNTGKTVYSWRHYWQAK